MNPEQRVPSEKTSLQTKSESGLMGAPSSGSSAMSEIMSRSLAHIQTSKALETRHRIGGQELHGPDYRLVCTWAEELRMSPKEVLLRLLYFAHETLDLLDSGHSLVVSGDLEKESTHTYS